MNAAPLSIGILMDGNRRWAKEHGLSTYEGHRVGVSKIKDVMRWAWKSGVQEVVIYGFSTENWNRAPEEVQNLMSLFETTFGGPDLEELIAEGVRIRFIGERSRIPKSLQKKMHDAEVRTKDLANGTLIVGLSYGGRAEILDAVNTLIREGKQDVDEVAFKDAMWSRGTLDPDMVIRTGGDRRLSNFLPWQSVYSELFFTNTYWPAFTKEEFDGMLHEFSSRDRRHGR